MKALALVVVLVAGCRPDGGDGYPVRPGGGGPVSSGGTGGTRDAGTGDAGFVDGGADDAGPSLTGRVCVLSDLRQIGDLTACASTGAAALTVTLGSRTATTVDDGSFRIAAPAGGGLVWRVTDPTGAIVTSVTPFGADLTIPAVSEATYNDLLGGNGIVINEDQGSIVVRAVSISGGPVSGVTGSLPDNASDNDTLYDTESLGTFEADATEAAGIVWFPGVIVEPPPSTEVPVTLTQPPASVTQTLPVESGAITFATMELP